MSAIVRFYYVRYCEVLCPLLWVFFLNKSPIITARNGLQFDNELRFSSIFDLVPTLHRCRTYPFYENRKKHCLDIRKKYPDWVHVWFKCLIWDSVFTASRRKKFQNISLQGLLVCCRQNVNQSALSRRNIAHAENSWLRACIFR